MRKAGKIRAEPISHIVSVSAECSGIAQRGGLGSVVWGLNDAYAQAGHAVSLIIPFYEEVSIPVKNFTTLKLSFGAIQYDVPVLVGAMENFTVYLISSERFFRGEYANLYIDSGKLGRGYFEDDARRFAFFCKAAAELLLELDSHSLHCHDWHTAYLLMLLEIDPKYASVREKVRTLFTIHNLEYQGTRPLAKSNGDLQSLLDYYPELETTFAEYERVKKYLDPHADIPCFNPMRAALNAADVVTTVSPTYAREICKSDDAQKNFFGGRRLEKDLQKLFAENRLFGILNGIDYDYYDPKSLAPSYSSDKSSWARTRLKHRQNLIQHFPSLFDSLSASQSLVPGNFSLGQKLQNVPKSAAKLPWVTVISRMTGQKMSLLLETVNGKTVLEAILEKPIFCVLLGKGDLQEIVEAKSSRFTNVLFFAGFDDNLEKNLLASSDIFLMPSDFEPCGTSQMKAMCYGSVPLVNHVGGLADSIIPEVDGFAFKATSRDEAVRDLLAEFDKAVDMVEYDPKEFRKLQVNAMQKRFSWQKASAEYLALLAR